MGVVVVSAGCVCTVDVLPEESEVFPVFAGSDVAVGAAVGSGVGSGVGNGVGEGVGVGVSSRKIIVTGVASGSSPESDSDSKRTARGDLPLLSTSTTCQTMPPTTNSMTAAPIKATFFLLSMNPSFLY